MIRCVDLFCGIGGFRLGLERVAEKEVGESGENPRKGRNISSTYTGNGKRGRQYTYGCVWSNDNDKYACKIYRKRFGEVHEGDIRTVDIDTIPEHNLLCAGFPCQSFSIAGKRKGFEDTRGTLFFEICRVIRVKRPSYLLLENVKGLLSHDNGHTFETIIGTLDELGYDLQWQVLNSKDFGVPQNRERVFIIGHTREKPRPKVFPLGDSVQETTQEGYEQGISGTLSVKNQSRQAQWDGSTTLIMHENKSGKRTPHKEAQALRRGASHNYQTIVASLKPEIGGEDDIKICDTRGFNKPKSWHYPKVYGEVSGREIEILETILRKRRKLNRETDGGAISLEEIGTTKKECEKLVVRKYLKEDSGKYDLYRTSGRIQDWAVLPEVANALDADGYLRTGARPRDKNGKPQLLPIGYRRIRRLTPLECERLQGFPDGWTEGISDTQRYKCLGNAVTVNVIEAIGRQLAMEVCA